MLTVGKIQIVKKNGLARLCAPVRIDRHTAMLWFAVEASQADFFAADCADPFVMALLPAAMRGGHEIVCEDPMSERLHWQLTDSFMPALASAGDIYRRISIRAPLTSASYPNRNAVGTGFSGGVDSLYSILKHKAACEYPLTHIAVFNSGVFEGEKYRDCFKKACGKAAQFAAETGLETVFVDTNFHEVLPERFLDVYSFRNLACALALQGLFSMYLLSSGHDAANFQFNLHNAATFDPLTVACASTESLSIYNSGTETKRRDKLAALTKWPQSYRWLHPCIYGYAGEKNCGHCLKCARDLTTLYALHALDTYEEVIDVPAYRHHIAARIGFVLANRGNHLYDETLELMEARHITIPPAAYIYEKQFRRAMDNLSTSLQGREK